ncbi:hypothetical protein KTC96_00440 [Clostridium estertheticum]|uniref:hypothetical protein n=1 Tax=Clostridium estertheticum TaxID=238834 RepID=UPI001C7CCA69|nr:hypothetical protein [Clostridium estertheticum]MBX4259625.1 hypothetical protein [Clostridium estertheticum]WLC70549.1 hypothetical protein KTC96_00440 [Clostridium estertheticum]
MRKKPWVNSPTNYNNIKSQLTSNINPINLENDPIKVYQFVELNYSDCVSADVLNTIFGKNNALSGEGQVFIDAAQKSNVNPLYLSVIQGNFKLYNLSKLKIIT